jgi:hypothetical protein
MYVFFLARGCSVVDSYAVNPFLKDEEAQIHSSFELGGASVGCRSVWWMKGRSEGNDKGQRRGGRKTTFSSDNDFALR